jgi:predicted transcriptional regulator
MRYLVTAGSTIRRRREALGLTQVRLAGLAGITQPTISLIEAGHDTRHSTIGKILEALDGAEVTHTAGPETLHPKEAT